MKQPLHPELEAVSRALQGVHKEILEAEGAYLPGRSALTLLDRLLNDPEWTWLRALVFGIGEPRDSAFLDRYRPLLQHSAALASAHGELKRLVDAIPAVK